VTRPTCKIELSGHDQLTNESASLNLEYVYKQNNITSEGDLSGSKDLLSALK